MVNLLDLHVLSNINMWLHEYTIKHMKPWKLHDHVKYILDVCDWYSKEEKWDQREKKTFKKICTFFY